MMDDQQARYRHALEQWGAMAKDIATAIAGYHHALVTEGMDPGHALVLCVELQKMLLSPHGNASTGPV